MKRIKTVTAILLTLCLMLPVCCFGTQTAKAAGKWVAAWTTSTVSSAVSVSGMSLQDIIPSKSTIRTELTVTAGGTKLRFCFSNQYGSAPIRINEASVAKTDATAKAGILDDTQTAITFDSNAYVDIPVGGRVWSDEIKFNTRTLDKISVSLYFENLTYITSAGLSNGRTYLSAGGLLSSAGSKVNSVALSGARELNMSSGAITYHTIPFLCGVDAYSSSSDACAAVFIGDSTLVNDTYLNYAVKAVTAGAKNVSVVNQAIVGNKLLSKGTGLIGKLYGDALIDRFDRDVLQVAGVRYCFVKIGLNDILHQYTKSMQADTPKYSAQDIINGYNRLIEKAHANGINIYFFSKTPWNGYERSFLGQTGDLQWNPEAQAMCDALDKWILSDNGADGFIDCSALASPADATRLCPSFTLDGAHLTQLGSIALADLIPLEYIGVKSANVKSSAEINGVDPYAEKRQIEYDMQHKPAEPATDPAQQQEEPATVSPEASTDASEQTSEPASLPSEASSDMGPTQTVPFVPVTESVPFVTNPYVPASDNGNNAPTTNPIYNYEIEYASNKNIQYIVNDVETDVIGTDAPVMFILFLVSSIVAASAMVILTIGKKKEF